jgi:hypothetical protein
LRRVLVELGHRLLRTSDTRWSKFAANMLLRGKPKNAVIAAVANRWVRWLHHELRRENSEGTASARDQQKGSAPTASLVASA